MSETEGVDLSFLRAGQAEVALLGTLTGALNVARLHDLGNVAVQEAVRSLANSLTAYLRLREEAVVLVAEQRVYLNGRLARGHHGGRDWQDDFLGFMERMGLGGMVFTGSWTEPTVKQALAIMRHVDKEVAAGQRTRTLARELGQLPGASQLLILDTAQAELYVQEEAEGYVSVKERASYYFARLVALAEVAQRQVLAGDSPDVHTRHLRQTVMRLIDHLPDPQFEVRLLGLTALAPMKGLELVQHGANTAVLSLCLGRLLGLERGGLADLTYAGLFHDLGRIGVEHVSAPGGDGEDRGSAEEHIVRGVQYCLRARQYGSTGLLRMVAVHEHHSLLERYPRGSAIRDSHVLSGVVGIADAFDRLQNGLPWRPAVSPRQALNTLLSNPDIAPAYPVLLRDMLGTYPRGTTLRLWDGSVAVVVAGGARRGNRPIVRRLLDANMAPDPEQALVELPDPDQVSEEVDPQQFSIDWRSVVVD